MAKPLSGGTSQVDRAVAWTYLEWQQRIVKGILEPQFGGRTVSLFIDGVELGRLSNSDPSRAINALVSAVASQFVWRGGGRLFDPILQLVAKWNFGPRSDPPPVVPLLAVTVLAATEFDPGQKFNPNAYYPRLAELFTRAGYEVSTGELLEAFDSMDRFWESLADWVDRSPRYGAFPLVPIPRLRRIGYSLTQAVVHATDRARLTLFFEAIDLDPVNLPREVELLKALRIWATRERGLSRHFLEVLRGPDAHPLLMPTLMSLAARWDGRVVEATGRRLLPISLALDLDEAVAEWVIPTRSGVEAEKLVNDAFGSIEISWPPFGSTYEVTAELPDVSATIDRQFAFSGDSSTALHRPKSVYVLGFDDLVGKWIERNGIEPFEEHVIVVASGMHSQAAGVIKRAADPGWRIARQSPARPVVRGYVIYESVVFSDADSFASALEESGGIGAVLRPDKSPVPHLSNGLRLPVKIGSRHHYLRGGEPDLILPKGDAPERIRVSLDGVSQMLWTSDFPVPLRANPPLEPGRHVIEVEERRLEFQILDQLPMLSFGSSVEVRDAIESWADGLSEAAVVDMWTLPRGRADDWMVDCAGRARRIEKPDVPEWICAAGLPEPSRYTPVLHPNDVWVIRAFGSVILDVQQVGARRPINVDRDDESRYILQRVTESRHAHDNPVLRDYLTVWASGRNRT